MNRITKGFFIKDIFEYEYTNNINIRTQLKHGELFIVVDLIAMSLKCTTDDALNILDDLLEEYSFEEIIQEIAIELAGKKAEKDDMKVEDDNKSFTDILTSFFNEMQAFDNISISEFMSMNTTFMYQYAEGIKDRYIINKNRQLKDEFDNNAMFLSMFGGKTKRPPQIKESDFKTAKQIKEERIQAMRERRGL